MMRRVAGIAAIALLMTVGALTTASAQNGRKYSATLVSAQENPGLAQPGVGRITLKIGDDEIAYELSFEGLADVRQAHIHFEKPALNGGIMLWLCNSATNPGPTPTLTPPCPVSGGTVSGTLAASDVQAIVAQKLTAGDFNTAVDLIRGGFAYANVHTGANPGGQIRGQIGQGGDHR